MELSDEELEQRLSSISRKIPVSDVATLTGVSESRLRDWYSKHRKVKKRVEHKDLDELNDKEKVAVLRVAGRYFQEYPNAFGVNSRLTSLRVLQTVQFMMATGCHLGVIADPEGRRLRVKSDSTLDFDRMKKEGRAAGVPLPIFPEMKPWIEEYVQWLRSRHGIQARTLQRILKFIGRQAHIDRGKDGLCQLVLRHTAGMSMADNGVSASLISQWLNCTIEVAENHYLRKSTKRLEFGLKGAGAFKAPWAGLEVG